MIFLSKPKLSILTAGERNCFVADKAPFKIGTSFDCNVHINSGRHESPICLTFDPEKKSLFCEAQPQASVFVDGVLLSERREIRDDKVHFAVIGKQLFYFCYSKKSDSTLKEISGNSFIIYNYVEKRILERNMTYRDLLFELDRNSYATNSVALVADGSDICVPIENLYFEYKPEGSDTGAVKVKKIDEDFGELICPSCWLHFSPDDINYIAVHASLMGDPLLGEDEKLRFLPVKYNALGVPLDPMGVPARERACPHCHRRLPNTFMQMKNDIISIVGAPSSGKSYYLSILLHYMPEVFFKFYNVAFVDADPPLNAVINGMISNLFSNSSDDHFLAKTQLEGGMYDKLIRHGKKVSLPKPFVYIMRDLGDPSIQTSLTFYDNAGEHFEPNINIDDSPGSLHVAFANGLVFLYDPLSSPAIRGKLRNCKDPQLIRESVDQQPVILAEMSNRIKQIRNNSYDLETPFAFIVNKCDAIKNLLDYSSFENPISNGKFDFEIVAKNSKRIREFLLGIVPDVVINAEMVSRNIMYFIASPFGHSPRVITNEAGEKYIAPEMSKIKPIFIEQPFVWIFSQLDGNPLNLKLNASCGRNILKF